MVKKAPAPSDTADKFMLRLPDGMRDRIAEAAKRNRRSMNAEIVARLEMSLETEPSNEIRDWANAEPWEPDPSEMSPFEADLRKLLSERDRALDRLVEKYEKLGLIKHGGGKVKKPKTSGTEGKE